MPRKFVDRLEPNLRQATDQIADLYVANLAAEAGVYSTTLAESFFRTPLQPTPKGFSFRVETPFFWANLIDRGRNAVSIAPPRKLAFFANPLEDDPRLRGGYHRTYEEAANSRLDMPPDEFKRAIKEGRLILTNYAAPLNPTNFVIKAKGRFKRDAKEILGRTARTTARSYLKEITRDVRINITL